MTEDAIRDLLAGLPQAPMIRRPPGRVAIERERIVSADADVEAVDAWVVDHGGAIRRTAPIRSQGRGGGQMTQHTTPGVLYYLLPAEALRG
jgi:hypothetical protein